MPRLPLNMERLALFGTLLATFGELHPACDHRINAAKAVSTFPDVSLRGLSWFSASGRSATRVSRLIRVNVVRRSASLRVVEVAGS